MIPFWTIQFIPHHSIERKETYLIFFPFFLFDRRAPTGFDRVVSLKFLSVSIQIAFVSNVIYFDENKFATFRFCFHQLRLQYWFVCLSALTSAPLLSRSLFLFSLSLSLYFLVFIYSAIWSIIWKGRYTSQYNKFNHNVIFRFTNQTNIVYAFDTLND